MHQCGPQLKCVCLFEENTILCSGQELTKVPQFGPGYARYTKLYLRYNMITTIETSKSYDVLDVRDNPLQCEHETPKWVLRDPCPMPDNAVLMPEKTETRVSGGIKKPFPERNVTSDKTNPPEKRVIESPEHVTEGGIQGGSVKGELDVNVKVSEVIHVSTGSNMKQPYEDSSNSTPRTLTTETTYYTKDDERLAPTTLKYSTERPYKDFSKHDNETLIHVKVKANMTATSTEFEMDVTIPAVSGVGCIFMVILIFVLIMIYRWKKRQNDIWESVKRNNTSLNATKMELLPSMVPNWL